MRATNEEDIDQLALAWELPQTNNDLWPTLCARLEAEQREQIAPPPTQTTGDRGNIPPTIKTAIAMGDDESFNHFQREYQDRLYAWLLNQTNDERVAEDLTVETYIRANREWSTQTSVLRDWLWLHEIAQSLLSEWQKASVIVKAMLTEAYSQQVTQIRLSLDERKLTVAFHQAGDWKEQLPIPNSLRRAVLRELERPGPWKLGDTEVELIVQKNQADSSHVLLFLQRLPQENLASVLAAIHQELQGLREDNQTLRREVLALREEVQRQNRRPGDGVQLLPYASKSEFPLPFS